MQLSLDGVSQAKSTSVTLDVYSIKFLNCRSIYPVMVMKPIEKYPLKYKETLAEIIEDIHDNNLQITEFIGDNPKRAIVREALNHASRYACEYCYSPAVNFKVKDSPRSNQSNNVKTLNDTMNYLRHLPGTSSGTFIEKTLENLQKLERSLQTEKINRSQLVWPHSTSYGPPRTNENTLAIVNSLDLNSPDVAKGMVGRSLFLDINYFDFTHSIPAEYMHSACLGLVKRMVELTFSVGDTRTRVTKRRLSSPSVFNSLMRGIKVPREFSRRVRQLDFGVLKAQEFRNLSLFFFPIIIQCINQTAKERRLWLLLTYMIRSCIIPDLSLIHI